MNRPLDQGRNASITGPNVRFLLGCLVFFHTPNIQKLAIHSHPWADTQACLAFLYHICLRSDHGDRGPVQTFATTGAWHEILPVIFSSAGCWEPGLVLPFSSRLRGRKRRKPISPAASRRLDSPHAHNLPYGLLSMIIGGRMPGDLPHSSPINCST